MQLYTDYSYLKWLLLLSSSQSLTRDLVENYINIRLSQYSLPGFKLYYTLIFLIS